MYGPDRVSPREDGREAAGSQMLYSEHRLANVPRPDLLPASVGCGPPQKRALSPQPYVVSKGRPTQAPSAALAQPRPPREVAYTGAGCCPSMPRQCANTRARSAKNSDQEIEPGPRSWPERFRAASDSLA